MGQNSNKMLIGAVIAAALAIAVYYGLIGQQQATSIQNQANQTLGTSPAQQQVVPPATTIPAAQTPAAQTPTANVAPQNAAPVSHQ